jgi:hypothetical protein
MCRLARGIDQCRADPAPAHRLDNAERADNRRVHYRFDSDNAGDRAAY